MLEVKKYRKKIEVVDVYKVSDIIAAYEKDPTDLPDWLIAMHDAGDIVVSHNARQVQCKHAIWGTHPSKEGFICHYQNTNPFAVMFIADKVLLDAMFDPTMGRGNGF